MIKAFLNLHNACTELPKYYFRLKKAIGICLLFRVLFKISAPNAHEIPM